VDKVGGGRRRRRRRKKKRRRWWGVGVRGYMVVVGGTWRVGEVEEHFLEVSKKESISNQQNVDAIARLVWAVLLAALEQGCC
jgi:hypothetical protein